MTNQKWDLKLNYMLAFTVCKYGLNPERWNLIASDLSDYINTTPQTCKSQFDSLCEQYGQDWPKQSVEPLHSYIFSIIKRLYYGDLCERMTESRDLLMVMYDFIRLFKSGRISPNDINQILQDIKSTVTTNDNEQQQKIKMLERLKLHMINQISRTSDTQQSSYPVELLPPPPFFQQQSITTTNPLHQQIILPKTDNDRQVPSMDNHQKLNTNQTSLPVITHLNNIHLDEIELSSDDDHERTAIAHTSTNDETGVNLDMINEQDESTFISDEPTETNQSSNIQPDKDFYDNGSTTSISNQSTFDTKFSAEEPATSTTNDQPVPLNPYGTFDNNNQHQSVKTESTNDDEAARMDAEPIPDSNRNGSNIDEQNIKSEPTSHEHDESVNGRISRRPSRLIATSSIPNNYRKSIMSVLNNLKTAKYGPDFAKTLKSFKLPDDYYSRIKKPLDIPEIRERMNNGDYDDNILLFERDILLMFTNALLMYHRDLDIHQHAEYMINYTMELFTPVEDVRTPWKTNVDETCDNLSNEFHSNSNDNLVNNHRRQVTTTYPTAKRQRKTTH